MAKTKKSPTGKAAGKTPGKSPGKSPGKAPGKASAKPAAFIPLWQKLVLGVFSLPLAALVLPSLMVLAIGMVPTAVAFAGDRSREKYLTITVGLPNFCGCLPAVAKLWSIGQSFSGAQEVLADPLSWAAAVGAAGLGWIVYIFTPPVVAVYYAAAGRAREQTLKRLQKTLVETWGEDVVSEFEDEAAKTQAARSGPAGTTAQSLQRA